MGDFGLLLLLLVSCAGGGGVVDAGSPLLDSIEVSVGCSSPVSRGSLGILAGFSRDSRGISPHSLLIFPYRSTF